MKALLVSIAITFCGTVVSQDTTGVREMIEAYGIEHPDIVMRQLCLESHYLDNNWKDGSSWICCNNPFGFFYKGSYLEFDNLEHAIEYYKWWQNKLYHGGDYYLFLERIGFATAEKYSSTLKSLW
jgi:hypothetical protein